ncbi:proteasome subunit beta type-4-like [Teleopsis dalmanni]|uniref:proteasome subunit beta type-4-like n=1 Tax=Teleopsis dalmanni TaxID=139649 RepID=UPI0018CD75A4|nr:proteasome subunit beta type-4-like [Teleopsis dalmanni]
MFNGGNSSFPTEFWQNGPSPGSFYNFTSGGVAQTMPADIGKQHSFTPATTGTSVVGIKYENGVLIAADTLVSYGNLARFTDVERVFKVNDFTIIGTGGDYADFQNLQQSINQKVVEDMCSGDKLQMKPKSLYNWLTRVLYNRRSRMNPLFLNMVVGGMENGKPFLGHIDLRGSAYESEVIATGFGQHLALPLIREALQPGKPISEQQAFELLHKVMEVLYYRDCRAHPKYTVAVCTEAGTEIKGPFRVDENWALASLIEGY